MHPHWGRGLFKGYAATRCERQACDFAVQYGKTTRLWFCHRRGGMLGLPFKTGVCWFRRSNGGILVLPFKTGVCCGAARPKAWGACEKNDFLENATFGERNMNRLVSLIMGEEIQMEDENQFTDN